MQVAGEWSSSPSRADTGRSPLLSRDRESRRHHSERSTATSSGPEQHAGHDKRNTRAGTRRGRLGESRRYLPCQLRRQPRRGRRGVLRLRGWSPCRRSVGRPRRSRGEPSVGEGHHRRRRIHDQRRDRDLRPPVGAARRARSGRSGGQVLAGVRLCRQGADPGALAAFTPGRAADRRRTADLRGGLRLASGHPGTGGAEAGVGAGHRARLPQRDLRVPGRGARAPDHRQVARSLLRRRGRRPARLERLDRAAPGSRKDEWHRSSMPLR